MDDQNIWIAAGDGLFDKVKELVESGVSVNAQDDQGYTPLHAACSYRNLEIATWLIEKGADVNIRDVEGDTPLMACEDPACANLLIAHQADLTATNLEGHTAFHIATWEFRDEMLEWLQQQYASKGLAVPVVPDEGDENVDERVLDEQGQPMAENVSQ